MEFYEGLEKIRPFIELQDTSSKLQKSIQKYNYDIMEFFEQALPSSIKRVVKYNKELSEIISQGCLWGFGKSWRDEKFCALEEEINFATSYGENMDALIEDIARYYDLQMLYEVDINFFRKHKIEIARNAQTERDRLIQELRWPQFVLQFAYEVLKNLRDQYAVKYLQITEVYDTKYQWRELRLGMIRAELEILKTEYEKVIDALLQNVSKKNVQEIIKKRELVTDAVTYKTNAIVGSRFII